MKFSIFSLKKIWLKHLNRPGHNFQQALADFSKSLTLIVDIDQLKDNVIAKIQDIISVDTIIIYFLNVDVNRFQPVEMRGYHHDELKNVYFSYDDPLIRWLTVNESYLVISKNPGVFSYFSEQEQKFLTDLKIELIFPLVAMNRITGFFLFSRKNDSSKFHRDEIELLSTLLGQASLAFENALLYQQQKSRFKKMYRADRLATLGQLAAGAAHEIRNPLTSVRSTIQYLKKTLTDKSKIELINGIIGEVDRIDNIIERLLSFSRPNIPQKETIDLRALLEQVLTLVSVTATRQNVNINFQFNSEHKLLQVDSNQLKQVFLNIIMNSLQAMSNGGELKLLVNYIKNLGKGFYHIRFQDNGKGIETKNMDRIFDPFFTTKNDGTGLGLSISYSIIHQHNGDIEIESSTDKKNHGTIVTIKLPG